MRYSTTFERKMGWLGRMRNKVGYTGSFKKSLLTKMQDQHGEGNNLGMDAQRHLLL